MNSFVTNSILIQHSRHQDEPLFYQTDSGDILARLDGFLVISKERVPDLDAFLLSLRVDPDPSSLAV